MSKYSIEQFSEITGLNKILIRTWENRYDFVKPVRSKTNIRSYSDAMLVKGIKFSILVENGYKISKLIKLNEKELNESIESILINNKNIKAKNRIYISRLIQSAINFDQILFDKTYKDCVKDIGLIDFYSDVILKTMNKIGILFLNSKINPAHEHFLSENVRIKISSEIDKIKSEEKIDKNWVLFLPENEFHDISLLFAKYLLKSKKFSTTYLGQNVPRESLLSTKGKKVNYVCFLRSNKSNNYINELLDFLSDNLKESTIYMITSNVIISKKYKNIKQIKNFKEFVNILDSNA